ncbi:MAG: hypothetical protein IE933_03625 [Sphingomonadales bacterium]|nr:hypothetical protein [Sphingomonadales bacterium]MBD3772134.1 hypothetical protein [Paracoccaceae bacterium]MBD3814525.1 hypothetical protein [Betaproteobacteria bacterium]
MHRIDTPGSVDGKFQDGNPAIGQQATQLLSAWFNDVQETLAYVIEQQGIVLEKGDNTQLRAAIIALIAGVVGDGAGAVPTTRTVTGAGLLAGQGGALAADLIFTLAKAAAADLIAGADDAKVATPLGIAQAFAPVLGTNSYWRGPGGILFQTGKLRGAFSEGSVSITFPTTFTTACAGIIPVAVNQAGNNDYDINCQNVSQSNSGAVIFFNYDGSGANTISGLDYIAFGK